VVEHQGVAVRILEERLVADAGVDGVREGDAARLELGARRLDVLDVQRDRDRWGTNSRPIASASITCSVRLPVSNSPPGTRSYTAEQGRPSTVP
jgi:hypothetical protein